MCLKVLEDTSNRLFSEIHQFKNTKSCHNWNAINFVARATKSLYIAFLSDILQFELQKRHFLRKSALIIFRHFNPIHFSKPFSFRRYRTRPERFDNKYFSAKLRMHLQKSNWRGKQMVSSLLVHNRVNRTICAKWTR